MANENILIIGGGPTGLEAARGIADLGYKAILVEMRAMLGGTPEASGYAALTPDMRDAGEAMQEMRDAVENNPNVEIMLNTEVTGSTGSTGDFKVSATSNGKEVTIDAGAVIIATGFTHFDPGRETQKYGYYEHDDVVTLVDAEKLLKSGNFVRPSTGEKPKRVAFIQCVGSRDRQIGNEYCSKVCCGISSKQAIEIREMLPDCKVFIFYIDMRMYGYWENEIYWPAQEKHKVNYIKGMATEIIKKGDTLIVKGEDTTMRRPMEVPMDMVVLAVGMEPSAGTIAVADIFDVKKNKYNFIETIGCISAAGAAAMKSIAAVRRVAVPA